MELIREYFLGKSYSFKHTKTVEMANSKHLEKTVTWNAVLPIYRYSFRHPHKVIKFVHILQKS